MSLISALLFPVPPPSYTMHSFPGELLWIPYSLDYNACKPGDCMPVVFLNGTNARYLVLYLHANGEDVGLSHSFGASLRLILEVHVLLVEYPGYGLCPGESSEESLWKAADAAFRFVEEVLHWPAEDVIVMGRSLGAALATRLARTRECHGLILVAPFLSLAEAVGQYIGSSLARVLVGDAFSNRESMAGIKVPTMVIHGAEDGLVPCSHGRRLFELCPHERKVFFCPEGMSHNCDLLSDPDFFVRPMLSFFNLPDYNFDELVLPREAFDKRLCLQYHNLVELTKGHMPMPRLFGDQEPCPTYENARGPESRFQLFEGSRGDTDDLSGSAEFTVRSQYGGRASLGGVLQLGQVDRGAGASPTAVDSLDAASTEATSCSQPTKPSDSLSAEGLVREDSLNPPGLGLLDLEGGISRFLRETTPPRVFRDVL